MFDYLAVFLLYAVRKMVGRRSLFEVKITANTLFLHVSRGTETEREGGM
jgi:hypothetical protein